MKLTQELFVIPSQGNFYLYAPLEGVIMEVNAGMIKLLKKIERNEIKEGLEDKLSILGKERIVTYSEKEEDDFSHEQKFSYQPSEVTLIPTFDCNLRCIYCYARSGEGITKDMNLDIAKSAIDLIITNAKKRDVKMVKLTFRGGGEPFLKRNINLLKKAVSYFQRGADVEKLEPRVEAVTNGLIDRRDMEWILDNFDELRISLDGPKEIHDKQRPKANGKSSFGKVLETIEYMEDRGFNNYGLRAVITKETVERMPEIVEFFYSISSAKKFQLEPLFEWGRCEITKTQEPFPEDFLRYYVQAKDVAKRLGVSVGYSGINLRKIHHYFCGAAGKNFFVTPEGNVTSCIMTSKKSEKGSEIFFIGHYDRNAKSFVFNDDKINNLRKRKVENISNCKDCFCRYNCCGDCSIRIYAQSGNIFDTSDSSRCIIHRGVFFNSLERLFKKEIKLINDEQKFS